MQNDLLYQCCPDRFVRYTNRHLHLQLMKPLLLRRLLLICRDLMVVLEQRRIQKYIPKELRHLRWKQLHWAKRLRHLPRSHLLSCSQSVQRSDHYLAPIFQLIRTGNVRFLVQDKSRKRINERLRAFHEDYVVDFASQKTTVPRKLQVLFHSCIHTRKQVFQQRAGLSPAHLVWKTCQRDASSSRLSTVPGDSADGSAFLSTTVMYTFTDPLR